eukprot:1156892-Pelagomonas_calceolata.AAC.3
MCLCFNLPSSWHLCTYRPRRLNDGMTCSAHTHNTQTHARTHQQEVKEVAACGALGKLLRLKHCKLLDQGPKEQPNAMADLPSLEQHLWAHMRTRARVL